MKRGRSLKRLTPKQIAKAKAKQSYLDTEYTTATGEVSTLRDLKNLMQRANRRLKNAKSYVSANEYKALERKFETSISATAAFKSGTKRYSVQAMKKTTPAKLRAADTAVKTALASSYMSKKKYKLIPEKRFQSYLDKGYVKNREQFDMLIGLFSSEAWQVLHDSGLMDSDQLVQIMKDMVFSQGATSQTVADKISDLLQRYKDALEYRDWVRKNPKKYQQSEVVEIEFPSSPSEWDTLIDDSTQVNMEPNELANIKYSDEFYRRMRDDLIDIVRKG